MFSNPVLYFLILSSTHLRQTQTFAVGMRYGKRTVPFGDSKLEESNPNENLVSQLLRFVSCHFNTFDPEGCSLFFFFLGGGVPRGVFIQWESEWVVLELVLLGSETNFKPR